MSAQSLIANLPEWPRVEYEAFGVVERRPLGRIQQLTARFLGRNWIAIPHVTHHDLVDVSTFEERRKAWNSNHPDRKLTLLPALVQALAEALSAYPQFNVSLEGDGKTVVQKAYVNVGVAVDTPKGLLVPVVRDADRKSVATLNAEIVAVSAKAREKGLSMAEMSGGSISITSLGHIGGVGFTPIVNAPEVAILGVTKIQLQPAPDGNGGIAWRQMLPLSLSYDHRVINGADAARFVLRIADHIAAIDSFG